MSADKAIYNGAIPGMLRTLDPHSNFFDPKDLREMREDQSGHYYGVGMQVQGRATAKTIVMAPFVGSPAYKAGLRPGDVIVERERQDHRQSEFHRSGRSAEGTAQGTPVEIKVVRAKAPISRSSSISSATRSTARACRRRFC